MFELIFKRVGLVEMNEQGGSDVVKAKVAAVASSDVGQVVEFREHEAAATLLVQINALGNIAFIEYVLIHDWVPESEKWANPRDKTN